LCVVLPLGLSLGRAAIFLAKRLERLRGLAWVFRETMRPHITLCVIAGREAATITRFLNSWRDCFDSLVLVEAIGNQKSDGTMTIASDWCEANGKVWDRRIYKNADGCAWPHVDDFAAARNKAFAIGESTGTDWLFWADVDDLFNGDPQAFREKCESTDVDLWRFRYEIPDAGKVMFRERLVRADVWRAGKAKWVGAVHEVIATDASVRIADSIAVAWVHKPTEEKERDPKRNLRILTAQLHDCPTNLFYVAQEYHAAGNVANMQRFARLFLDMPNGDAAQQYQARLWLCAAADTHAEASQHALAAYWLFPYAEACAALVRCAMQEDRAEAALQWAEKLMDTPIPEKPLWCHEPRWYGWAAQDLYWRAARMNGESVPPQDINLYHRTGDPKSAVQLREVWMARAAHPSMVEFGFIAETVSAKHWLRQFALWTDDALPVGAREIKAREMPEQDWDLKL
jgi:hypothetical protein